MKLIIIGGVAGGATAAARARRLSEEAQIIMFERGEYISFANCGLPYYVGQIIKDREDLLVTTIDFFSQRYNIDIRNFTEVIQIDRKNKQVEVKNIVTQQTYFETYDKLILSPGAEPIKPPLPGIDHPNIFNVRNIPDSDRIKTFVDTIQPQTAVVVGGGFIGLEMAENLAFRGVKTTIVEMLDQVMAPIDFEMAQIVSHHLTQKGIECLLGQGVKAFDDKNGKIEVTLTSGEQMICDMVILSIGIRPEFKLAKEAGLAIGEKGGIIVDATLRTSDPDIYAVGDAIEVKNLITGLPVMTPLAGPANKQGRIAADNVMGRKSTFKGTLGTAVVKLFDLTIACTGSNEKSLKANNIPYIASYTHSGSHASYYPDAKMMAIKLIFSPHDGKILGAQIVGEKGVDKRIDVIATAIYGDMTVYDLEELELAYAPPYSSAKDPVNIAGFVASNILKTDMESLNPFELKKMLDNDHVLLDLRTKFEIRELGTLEGAVNIPLDDLRGKLQDLDKDKTYITFCAVGLRAYIGYRILVQNGFKAKSLAGGYTTFVGVKPKLSA